VRTLGGQRHNGKRRNFERVSKTELTFIETTA
jgi:hypothetical protein